MPPDPGIRRTPRPATTITTVAASMAVAAAGAASAQESAPSLHRSGRVTLGDASLEPGTTDGSALVRLRTPSRIDWDSLDLAAGESLRVRSETGSLASLHVVRSGQPARLAGRVTADGPFYLLSPGGLSLLAPGSVRAPRIFLSTLAAADESALLSGQPTAFSPAAAGPVEIDGSLTTTGGPLTVLGSRLNVTETAALRAPGSQIQLFAADSATVTASGAVGVTGVPPGPHHAGSSADLTTRGHLAARRIDLISEGFLRNGGRLETGGSHNRVLLSALSSTHEKHPDNASVIITHKLVVDGAFFPEGPIISPREGTNPGPVGGQRQTPRLSEPGFITQSDGRSTPMAYSPMQTLATTSPIPSTSPAPAVASRGRPDETTEPERPRPARRNPATVRKASFFGQTVKK